MPDRVQIGPAVDAKLWKRFREDVKSRTGTVRGNLGRELENAIREYLKDGPTASEQRMLERLGRIESAVGAAQADGGTHTVDAEPHTHAPSEKPAANAPTERKVEYLAERVREDHGGDFDEVARSVLIDTVKSEYGFRSDTAKRYVGELVEHFELEAHPVADGVLVTPERRAELLTDGAEEKIP